MGNPLSAGSQKPLPLMPTSLLIEHYRNLQRYVGWTDSDQQRVGRVAPLLSAHFDSLIEDFYETLQADPATARILDGSQEQIERLKNSLRGWLTELLNGPYDAAYVTRRWHVGHRHAKIGLLQMHTHAALSRLRSGMTAYLASHWPHEPRELPDTLESLNRLLDLDLAIIGDAYEGERLELQQRVERARMAAALHQEKQFADRLIERAKAIVLVLDTSGRILRFNPYLESLTGMSLEQVRGRDWFTTFVPSAERDRSRQLLLETLRDSDSSGAINQILASSGQLRSVSWSGTALKTVEGETVAVLAVGHDITELQEAQQRALQAERLAAIGQMITGLAHESRNALQRIQACAEMLEYEVEENAEATDLVRRIQSAQDHMHRLYEEVRGYAAPIQLELEPLQLPEVWHEAWELLGPQRGQRQAGLREEIEDGMPAVRADRFRLVQLFRNLMENSLAACPDPVDVHIQCRRIPWGKHAAVEVLVSDNGPGLDPQQRERIFQPFFTTKTKGTGLGMSIAQRIVEAHQGRIAVSDAPNRGAAIQVILPL